MTMLRLRPGRLAGHRFSNIFDNFLENEFPAVFQNEVSKWTNPSVNIKETKEGYVIDVAAPGFVKENFNIKVEGDMLTISAEVKDEQTQSEEKFTRQEFTYNSFKRSFNLPETVVADKIGAAYENGILKVTLPKAEEKKEKSAIEVKVA